MSSDVENISLKPINCMVIKIGVIKRVHWGKGKLVISFTCVLYQIVVLVLKKV
jgi:hypothetical protein